MEGRRVDENDIVDCDVSRSHEAKKTGVLPGVSDASDVALAIDGAETIAREHLDVVRILDEDRVAAETPVGREGYQAIELESPGRAALEDHAGCN